MRGPRINTDRFPERAPKAQGSRGGGGGGFGGMFPEEISWVCESFRQYIGQFHSPPINPWKSADYFMFRFQLGEVFLP